jgi:hypothetical protein
MTNKMLLTVAGLAALVSYAFYRGRHAKAVTAGIKEDLGRWEAEGGNVPAVATPSPAPVPQSSYPSPGSAARH